MRWMTSVAAAALLACFVEAARADELVGTVDNINPTRNTITVDGKIFAVSPHNTVGARIDGLQVGDRVSVFYASGRVQSETRFNAMRVEKQED